MSMTGGESKVAKDVTDRRDSKKATGEVKQGSASDGQIRPELTQFVTVQKKT